MAKKRRAWVREMYAEYPGLRAPVRRSGFDWAGVVVRHWYALRPVPGGAYRCVSRCGIEGVFRAEVLAQGATATCGACRTAGWYATGGDQQVAVPGAALARWRANWEELPMSTVALREKTNMRGADAVADWNQHGRPLVLALLDRTGLGREFGWSVTVRDAHVKVTGAGAGTVRPRGWHDNVRRLELAVRPKLGRYFYEVDLTTGRVDVEYKIVRAALERALREGAAEEVPGAPVPVPPLVPEVPLPEVPPALPEVPAPPQTILGHLEVSKLRALQASIDALITLGGDVDASAGLLAEAEAGLERALAAADPVAARVRALLEDHGAAERLRALTGEKVAELERALEAARAERARAATEAERLLDEHRRAEAEYPPLLEAVTRARAEVAEAQKLAEERKKALAQQGDLMAVFSALKRLGGG